VNYDLRRKAPIYARAGIIEYWVVDVPAMLVHVHRDPEHGAYTSIVKYGFEKAIRPLVRPDAAICMNLL
jgi:Uma2 family endonuclease